MTTNIRDPRTVITPDALEVSEALLGMPLAKPSARFWAILIDLIVISILTVATDSISLVIWGVVGFFFVQMAFRQPSQKMGQVTSMLFRGATGCLGLLILIGVGIGFLAVRFGGDDDVARAVSEGIAEQAADIPTDGSASLSDIIGAVSAGFGVNGLTDEDDPEVAEEILINGLNSAYRPAPNEFSARDFLEAVVDEDSQFTDNPDDFVDGVVARWEATNLPAAPGEPVPTGALAEARDAVADLSPTEVLNQLAALGDPDDFDLSDPRTVALRGRAIQIVAGDSLSALAQTSRGVSADLADTRRDLSDAQATIDEANTGFSALMRDIWEQLGSAFGLWSIYFTLMLTWFKGQTVGKKVMGIRVLRLDGEPINSWAAFERAGGYFAGIATGLLGFVQVYWDANRQCVHDKIGGTVVVVDGAVASESAWREAAGQQDPLSSPRSSF